jgi:hypothetical protein
MSQDTQVTSVATRDLGHSAIQEEGHEDRKHERGCHQDDWKEKVLVEELSRYVQPSLVLGVLEEIFH